VGSFIFQPSEVEGEVEEHTAEILRSLGRIEQKVDGAVIDHGRRLARLEADNETHKKFRWRIIGGVAVVGAFISGIPGKILSLIPS
jgi:hypothetical protein